MGASDDRALPTFRSKFLDHLCRGMEKRTKALKPHGVLSWESDQPDDYEWISFHFVPYVGPYFIAQFVEDNRVSIYLRSRRRRDRGKILFADEDISVVDNADTIVEAFELTIQNASELEKSPDSPEVFEKIKSAWAKVLVRIRPAD